MTQGPNLAGLGTPGVVPRQGIQTAIRRGWVHADAAIPERNVQPASLDLTLGPTAYRVRCSFLPRGMSVLERLREYGMGTIDLTNGGVLEQNRPYLIPLAERLALPKGMRGRTNPRSSTGRLDIFTRVLVDRGERFDEIPDEYNGGLWLEVVPRSFTVKVRAGYTMNQLRFIVGRPKVSDEEILTLHDASGGLVFPSDAVAPNEVVPVSEGLFLSVDLSMRKESGSRMRDRFVGYRARKSSALLDLEQVERYEIEDFWEAVRPDSSGKLILEPEEFYLLVSRERVRIPPTHAAEMAAYDPTSGELRTHYAGFFDPGFGDVGSEEAPGTAAVLEVRAHDVSFALEHGQRLCKLTFEPMQTAPDRAYGSAIGSRYQRQLLALGRQFKPGPTTQMLDDSSELRLFGPSPLRLAHADSAPDHVPLQLQPS